MKPAPFAYDRPANLAEAAGSAAGGARILGGGQSLGPMLNLRLARPDRLVPVAHLAELVRVEETRDAIILGAGITHAAIADGRTPDLAVASGDRVMGRIAGEIAYRAVRNRGTLGGSLAHADPAADWLCTLTALGAAVLTSRAGSAGRFIPLERFCVGAFRTALQPGEIVQAVRIPRPAASACWGYYKACRKPGEFAHAMAAVLVDETRKYRRFVIGAVGGPPVVLEGDQAQPKNLPQALAGSGLDPVGIHMQAVSLQRALERAGL